MSTTAPAFASSTRKSGRTSRARSRNNRIDPTDGQLVRGRCAGFGEGEREDRDLALAGQPQRDPAGRRGPRGPGRGVEEARDDVGAAAGELLHVVEHEQHAAVAELGPARRRGGRRPCPAGGGGRRRSPPAIRAASVMALRSTNTTPSGNRCCTALATSIARRVFPLPPGPVSVVSRPEVTASRPRRAPARGRRTRCAATAARCGGGRGCAAAGTRRRARRSRRRAGRSGCTKSLSRWLAEVAERDAGREVVRCVSAAVVAESTIWPPCPAAAIRAALFTSIPR